MEVRACVRVRAFLPNNMAMTWDELRLVIRASRIDALTGLHIGAKCVGAHWIIIYCSAPDDVEEVLQKWSCHVGGFSVKALTVQKLRWIGKGWYFRRLDDADADAAMRRLAADLSVVLAAKFAAGTLFRLLRRRAFSRAICVRVRARLVLSRAPLFVDLPEDLLRNIVRQWM